jgi:hypothetical protein
MPIDSAAPAYHWSDLKMTLLLRFLAMRARAVGFFVFAGFAFFTLFAICLPAYPPSRRIIAAVTAASQWGRKKAGVAWCRSLKHEKAFLFNDFLVAASAQGIIRGPAMLKSCF